MKVLIINSYGGSLVLAATQRRDEILASCEDSGYGTEVQRANFPRLDIRNTVPEWPDQSLKGVTVIAHPPCAQFSAQNKSNAAIHGRRVYCGCDAPTFKCTEQVLDYSLKHGCAALAVESVPGALEGGREAHEAAARRYGYKVFRVLQNSILLGLPQWRPRCWVIFAKFDELRWGISPRWKSVGEVLEKSPTPIAYDQNKLDDQLARLARRYGRATANAIVTDDAGNLNNILHRRRLAIPDDPNEVIIGGRYVCNAVRFLNVEEPTPVLLSTSWWAVERRALSEIEWRRIMGYPDSYAYPQPRRLKEYLSRGVCPPVARWVLDTIDASLNGGRPRAPVSGAVKPGETLTLAPSKGWFASARDTAALPRAR